MAKNKARVFGQDLMRGENIVGGVGMSKAVTGGNRLPSAKINKQTGKFDRGDLHVGVDSTNGSGTSIFDPVLCELAYTWFTAPGAFILDPFAGGSVRGIVASVLGRKYTGIDLRPEQIAANREQSLSITPDNMPVWIVGDSREAIPNSKFDFIFSCPPYADLEVYSDDPRDISTMNYDDFLEAYREIIAKSVITLKDDSFACFVVGEVRNKDGNYINFVSDTISAFVDAGCNYYNEAILITSLGSLPIRVGRQFRASRKLGKTHQNVLVFVKGDGKKAAARCGDIEIGSIVDNQD